MVLGQSRMVLGQTRMVPRQTGMVLGQTRMVLVYHEASEGPWPLAPGPQMGDISLTEFLLFIFNVPLLILGLFNIF